MRAGTAGPSDHLEQSLRPEAAQGTCVHAETELSSFRLSASFFLPFIFFFIKTLCFLPFFLPPSVSCLLLPLSVLPFLCQGCRVELCGTFTALGNLPLSVRWKLNSSRNPLTEPRVLAWCQGCLDLYLSFLSLSLSPRLFLFVLS